jgi:hypothetical protein
MHRSVDGVQWLSTMMVRSCRFATAPEELCGTELSEDEMRRALFGSIESAVPERVASQPESVPSVIFSRPGAPTDKKKATKPFRPRIKVTLHVSNEYEGRMFELIHEADTLSTLLAEQQAIKAARKKYRYVEVVSGTPM